MTFFIPVRKKTVPRDVSSFKLAATVENKQNYHQGNDLEACTMLTNPKAKGRGHSNSADKAGFLSIVRRVTRGNKGIHAKVLDHHRPLMGKSLK